MGGRSARRYRRPVVVVALVGAILAGAGVAGLAGASPPWAQATVPRHLDILAAAIVEVPPIDPRRAGSRVIHLSITLAGPLPCAGRTGTLAYGFLVDADENPATGATNPTFADLGVDARLSVRCDPRSGRFLSPLGPVSRFFNRATGATKLRIPTTLANLPSVRFRWIAYAQDGATLTRLPAAPGSGAFLTADLVLP